MTAQQNLLRTLTLIRLLKQRPGKTLVQLAQLLDCSARHVRRLMDTLEAVGYFVDQKGTRPPRFYIFENEQQQQARFTEEEAQLLQQALATYPDSNPLLTPLRQKIAQQATLLPLANCLVDRHRSRVVAQLAGAINERRQVRLINYFSANSNTVSDREVEPFAFSDTYEQLTAYDPDAGKVKTFKTQRIEDVVLLDTPQTYAPTEAPVDPFNWPGDLLPAVSICLTPMARRLLLEERPLTTPDIHPNPTDETYPYIYTGRVRSWVGLGRFLLGIPGHTRINAPAELREYVRGRIGEFCL